MDDEEAVARFRVSFADVIGQEVIGGLCFISRCCDRQQSCGLIYNDETLIFVENFQSFGQMFISWTFFLRHTEEYLTIDRGKYQARVAGIEFEGRIGDW